jgi:hypothetical protein
MDRMRLWWGLVALGAVLVILSALADPIGIGGGDSFGWKQVAGVVVGALAVLLGLWLLFLRRPATGDSPAVGAEKPG